MLDIISIGDTTIDTLMEISNSSDQCSVKGSKLQLNYADKIVVDKMHHSVAGNAANNAIGSSRLKMKTAIITILGDDQDGKWIKRKLKNEGVNTKLITVAKNHESNSSTVIDYKDERTILVYHAPRTYKLPRIPKAKWVYYTSVGEGHKRYNREVIAYLKSTGTKMAYNPGSHQLKTGFRTMKPVIKHAHALFVNKEEAQRILDKQYDIPKLLIELQKLGPEYIIITDGKNGSYVRHENISYHMGTCKGPVVERTGAGDAYASAFITALRNNKSIEQAMQWGSTNAANVIAHHGPQTGLQTKRQLEIQTKNTKLRARII